MDATVFIVTDTEVKNVAKAVLSYTKQDPLLESKIHKKHFYEKWKQSSKYVCMQFIELILLHFGNHFSKFLLDRNVLFYYHQFVSSIDTFYL